MVPFVDDWEENGTPPSSELYQKMGSVGLISAQTYPGTHLKGRKLLGNISPEQFDYFYEMITHQEMGRICAPGVSDSYRSGFVIGLPPVMKFA